MRKIENFIEHRESLRTNYSDYSLRVDVLTGYRLETIIIEPIGYFKVEGVRLIFTRAGESYDLVPPVILRTRPIEEPAYIVIPFLKSLDLRAYPAGDVTLGFSISNLRYPGARPSPVPEELVIYFHKTD